MKDINDYRRERTSAATAMTTASDQIGTLEAAGIDGEEQQAALDAAVAEFDQAQIAFNAADASVKRLEAVETASAASVQSEVTLPAAAPVAAATPKNPDDKGIEFGFMVHAIANAKGDKDRAVARLEHDGYGNVAAALSGATDGAGGVTIPRAQAADVIELLRPRVTVMNAGARMVDMPAGQVRNARQASSATASYAAENAATVESEQTFDAVDQNFKTLRSLVPVGNALLRHSSDAIGRLVRDDMLDVMGLRKDLGFLRGDGSAETPKGLGGWVLAGHTQTAIATGAAVVEASLRRMVSKVEDSDVMMTTGGWIMRASTKNFLASLRDPDSGAYLFPSIERSGELLGYPILTTSQLPDNLGVGGDESEVFFADFNEMLVGDSMSLTLSSSSEAAYVDTGGNTVSAFQNDLTLMRAIEEHDFVPRHDVAISKLTGAGWGL